MTAGLQGRGVISKLTWSVLKDCGWYDLPHDFSEPLVWGKDGGCDFSLKFCYEQLSLSGYRYVYCYCQCFFYQLLSPSFSV